MSEKEKEKKIEEEPLSRLPENELWNLLINLPDNFSAMNFSAVSAPWFFSV